MQGMKTLKRKIIQKRPVGRSVRNSLRQRNLGVSVYGKANHLIKGGQQSVLQ